MRVTFIIPLLYLFAIFVFLFHFLIVGKAVYGDGRYYFSYLPSVVIHHTFNFSNSFTRLGIVSNKTPLGLPANKYAIGASVVWLPAFLLAHIMLLPFSAADGYNRWYQIIIGIGNISLVFLGLIFLKKTLKIFFSETIASVTVLFLFLGTNLLFYGAVDVINSHSASFFASSMVLYFWLQKPTLRNALFLGFFLSLLALIRFQDIIFFLLPLTTLVVKRFGNLPYFSLTLALACITFIPQLFVWHILWGNWFLNPYLLHERFYFSNPQVLGVLFGKTSGLFLWTPMITLCIIGIYFFVKKQRMIGVIFSLLLLVELYIVSSWSTWWQGASYSGRMFTSCLPFLSFGLAQLLSRQRIQRIVITLCLLLCMVNPFLIIIFLKFIK